MIIPPDPEKDPRLFDETASTSTPSLLPPPTESDVDGGDIGAQTNPAYGYPYNNAAARQANGHRADGTREGAVDPFSDDLALDADAGGYGDEVLPPYSRRSRDTRNSAAVTGQAGTGAGAGTRSGQSNAYPNSFNPALAPSPSHASPELRERDPRTRSPPSQPNHVIVPINTSNLLGMGNGIAPSPLTAGTDGEIDTPTTPSARLSGDIGMAGESSAHLAGPSHAGHASSSRAGGNAPTGVGAGRGKVWEGSALALGSGSGSGKGNGKGKGKARGIGLLRKMKILPTDPTSPPSATTSDPSSFVTAHRSSRLTRGSSSLPQPIPIPSTSTLPTSFSDSEKPSPHPSPAAWWTKYKRWIIAALILLLIAIGALIGLVIGFKQQGTTEEAEAARARAFAQANGPAWHDLDPGKGVDGSMNLTWVDGRDTPPSSDGNLTACNIFTPLNSTARNFSTLYTPYPGNQQWTSTFLLPMKYFNSSSNTTTYLSSTGDLPVADARHASPLGPGSGDGSNESTASASASASASATSAGAGTGASTATPSGSSDANGNGNGTGTYNATGSSNDSNNSTEYGDPSSSAGLLRAYGRYDEIPIFARGVASTGTIEIIGADADPDVINGGVEGMVRIDVVMQYGGFQDVQSVVRVCEVVRADGSVGVGVYTPTETDGKITNPYMLDPTLLPSFHIIIRFPPSAVWERSPSILSTSSSSSSSSSDDVPPPLRFRSMNMHVDSMALRIGDLRGLADFGRFSFDAGRGGVAVDYLAAKQVWIATSENSVRGTFNVSESLYVNATDSSIIADIILHDPGMYSNTTITPTSWMAKRGPGDGDGYEGSEGLYGGQDYSGNGNSTNGWQASISSADWTPSTSSPADWGSMSTTNGYAYASEPSPSSWHSGSLSSSRSSSSSGSGSSQSQTDTADQLLATITNATISNTINTTIYTTDGLVSVSYLAHPPRTSLVSWIATNQGDMDISYHPNFVGPFAIRNAWGAVRLPPPRKRVWDDPLGLGRNRAVVEGVIAVSNSTSPPSLNDSGSNGGSGGDGDDGGGDSDDDGTSAGGAGDNSPQARAAVDDYMFTRAGLNETQLATSGTTVTGAAYWQAGPNGTMSPKAVQSSSGRRGTAVVLGGWGDVTVGFDGR